MQNSHKFTHIYTNEQLTHTSLTHKTYNSLTLKELNSRQFKQNKLLQSQYNFTLYTPFVSHWLPQCHFIHQLSVTG